MRFFVVRAVEVVRDATLQSALQIRRRAQSKCGGELRGQAQFTAFYRVKLETPLPSLMRERHSFAALLRGATHSSSPASYRRHANPWRYFLNECRNYRQTARSRVEGPVFRGEPDHEGSPQAGESCTIERIEESV